jgi:hypothetical protein
MSGKVSMTCSAAARSTAKLSLPPRYYSYIGLANILADPSAAMWYRLDRAWLHLILDETASVDPLHALDVLQSHPSRQWLPGDGS